MRGPAKLRGVEGRVLGPGFGAVGGPGPRLWLLDLGFAIAAQ